MAPGRWSVGEQGPVITNCTYQGACEAELDESGWVEIGWGWTTPRRAHTAECGETGSNTTQVRDTKREVVQARAMGGF